MSKGLRYFDFAIRLNRKDLSYIIILEIIYDMKIEK